ncbi:hypothetical protein ACFL4W_01405 [Planctomycetota bacterium]
MAEQVRVVSVISDDFVLHHSYAGLTRAGYALAVFPSINDARRAGHFYRSSVVILDDLRDIADWRTLVTAVHEEHPDIRIIVTGSQIFNIDPAAMPRTFFLLRKPFTPEKLTLAVDRAFTVDINHEQRRGPRAHVALNVDLFYENRFWPTHTTNLSLNGMQAIWPEPRNLNDLRAVHQEMRTPIDHCRLFVNRAIPSDPDIIAIPVKLRYISGADEDEDTTLLGFEFGDICVGRRLSLYKAMV